MMMTRGHTAMLKSSTDALRTALHRFVANERGATAIEYALIASAVAIAIVGSVATLGTHVKTFYSNVATALK